MHKNQHELVLWLAIGGLAAFAIAAQFSLFRNADQEAFAREAPEFQFLLPTVILPSQTTMDAAKVRGVSTAPFGPSGVNRSSDLLVKAIIELESHGNPEMVGGAGERGLMQLMETTWSDMSRRVYGNPLPFESAFDPRLNREMGTAYLDYLQEFLYRNQAAWQSDLRSLLLASYNFGPSAVAQAGFKLQRCPKAVRSYVMRGAALHDTMLEEEAAKAALPDMQVAQMVPLN